MRGKKAKAIRKIVYNGSDIHIREYLDGHNPQLMVSTGEKNLLTGNVMFRPNPTVICAGMRRMYQQLKAMVQVMGRKPSVYEAYKSLN